MRKMFFATLLTGSMALAACASTSEESRAYSSSTTVAESEMVAPAYADGPRDCRSVAGGAATGAAVGAAGGAGVGALVGGVSVLEGAIAGAVVGGIVGAVWTDRDNDGCVDGYTANGQYYDGAPPSYQSTQPVAERG